MPYASLLTICISLILGFGGVATIFVNGWVKSSSLLDVKADVKQLWEKVIQIEVLNTKLENIEKNVKEIKEIVKEQKR